MTCGHLISAQWLDQFFVSTLIQQTNAKWLQNNVKLNKFFILLLVRRKKIIQITVRQKINNCMKVVIR